VDLAAPYDATATAGTAGVRAIHIAKREEAKRDLQGFVESHRTPSLAISSIGIRAGEVFWTAINPPLIQIAANTGKFSSGGAIITSVRHVWII
jgi:hypothetical protein